ncbi:transmembrane protein 69-like [Palaemon carinicauda]|uniref:transmembrane protein 69-like n=1 Tax=Palaemon carinicauda TaxID=392227 RepID=UPI0035B69381
MIPLQLILRNCPRSLEGSLGSLSVRCKPLLGRFKGTVTLSLHTSARCSFKEDHETTSLALFENVKQVRHSPTPALLLGFSGLIPFVAAPLYMMNCGTFMPDVAQAQLYYGASILSFLGGVRWGLTLPDGATQPPNWPNLLYGVSPSLIAWLGLLAPQPVGVLAVIGGLGVAGYMDIAMWGYPGWYKGMRFCLTFVAVLSLWTSFMLQYVVGAAKNEVNEGICSNII